MTHDIKIEPVKSICNMSRVLVQLMANGSNLATVWGYVFARWDDFLSNCLILIIFRGLKSYKYSEFKEKIVQIRPKWKKTEYFD